MWKVQRAHSQSTDWKKNEAKSKKERKKNGLFFRKRKEPLFIYYITIGVRLFSPSNKYAMWCVFMTSHQMTWMVWKQLRTGWKSEGKRGKFDSRPKLTQSMRRSTHNTSTTTAYFNGYYGCLWMMKITSYKIEKFGSYSNRSEIKWKQKICNDKLIWILDIYWNTRHSFNFKKRSHTETERAERHANSYLKIYVHV